MSEAKYHEHYMWSLHADKSKVFGVLNLPVEGEDFRQGFEFPVVVCGHDIHADNTQLKVVTDTLASSRIVSYAIDLRGGGDSVKSDQMADGSEATVKTAADDLACAADLMLSEPFCDKAELFLCGCGLSAEAALTEANRNQAKYRGIIVLDAPEQASDAPEGMAVLHASLRDSQISEKVRDFVNDVIRNRWKQA